MAEPFVDDDFLVLNGDNIYRANLAAVLDRHAATAADLAFPVDDVSPEAAKGGAVCEFDADGTVIGLVEKPETPPSTTTPMAAYVLPPEIFPACKLVQPSERGEYELPDAIDLLIHAGYAVETVPFEGWKLNINTPDDLARATEKLESGE